VYISFLEVCKSIFYCESYLLIFILFLRTVLKFAMKLPSYVLEVYGLNLTEDTVCPDLEFFVCMVFLGPS
jgi:hypothetical protein